MTMATDAAEIWRRCFQEWPAELERRGVLITSFGDQIPFEQFATSSEMILIERHAPTRSAQNGPGPLRQHSRAQNSRSGKAQGLPIARFYGTAAAKIDSDGRRQPPEADLSSRRRAGPSPIKPMHAAPRLSSGVDRLDLCLGGGLIPGTLTVVVGASGIGKTQLGLHFAHAGRTQEGHGGILFDMSARIDSQGHAQYAKRMFDWSVVEQPLARFSPDTFFDPRRRCGDYLHVFDTHGRRVTQRDMGFDGWHDWQAELAAKLELTIAFFYGNFVHGTRRAVIDGIEPAERPSESIQFELFEYIYHQILRKDSEWVARDLFRQSFRAHADSIMRHAYDAAQYRRDAAFDFARNHARSPHRTAARRRRPAGRRQHGDLHGQTSRRRKNVARTVHRQAPRQRMFGRNHPLHDR